MDVVFEKINQWRHLAENDQLFDYIIRQLEELDRFGPLPGILLPLLEAFLPFLPLVAFVLANSVVYGCSGDFCIHGSDRSSVLSVSFSSSGGSETKSRSGPLRNRSR